MVNKRLIQISAILFCLGVVCIVLSGGSQSDDYTLEEKVLENYSNGNTILIKYPQLRSDDREHSAVNELIVQGLGQYLYDSYGQKITDLSLEMDYRVVRQDDKLFSVVFEGLGYVAQTAHPNDHLFTLTFDLTSQTRLTLSELYDLNEEFVQILRDRLLSQNSEVEEIFSVYADEELMLLLGNADQKGETAFSYLTENAVGISLPVAYAAGNHVETEIKFKDLRAFERRTLD